jgi:4-hydroxy-3-polyprenylbenzoate decarboxylase
MYRLQVYDGRTTGMHWHLHKGGAEHYRLGERENQRLEAAVAIGADPATIYAASAPLPPDFDEFMFAGFLRNEKLELVKCKTVNLHVPAQSEIVLEGYVDTEERRLEGPFGDHTGYYSLADQYPMFHITCITQRKQPIYPATIVGRPPMEDYFLGKATERLFLPLVQLILPEVVDMNMPAEGVFHNLLIVSIKKEYPGHTRKVMHALWGMMQMMLTKTILVVDEHVDVQDLSGVAWRALNNVDPRRDLVFADGPLDALDHSSPIPFYGSKLGIDATAKGPMDGHNREWPDEIVMRPDIKALVDRRWKEYGL